jgi:DNA-binding NarL/FixJ family response regulator
MTDEGVTKASPRLRVVVTDDDAFTASLVSGGLTAQGFDVIVATTTDDAWAAVESSDPHALVSDLNFGAGESAVAMIRRVAEEYPWVGIVVLTSHSAPSLAVEDAHDLPPGCIYIVKSRLGAIENLKRAVLDSIAGSAQPTPAVKADDTGVVVITSAQATMLRLLAEGASTSALAEHRGTTVRAAETMLARLYAALGVGGDDKSNPRVAAVRLWQQGRVTVR